MQGEIIAASTSANIAEVTSFKAVVAAMMTMTSIATASGAGDNKGNSLCNSTAADNGISKATGSGNNDNNGNCLDGGNKGGSKCCSEGCSNGQC